MSVWRRASMPPASDYALRTKPAIAVRACRSCYARYGTLRMPSRLAGVVVMGRYGSPLIAVELTPLTRRSRTQCDGDRVSVQRKVSAAPASISSAFRSASVGRRRRRGTARSTARSSRPGIRAADSARQL
jgi:hypothetical protein